MTFDEFRQFLNTAQSEMIETKIMNAVLSCYQEIKEHEKLIIELQKKVNQIAQNWNEEIENAAPVNQEEDIIDADIAAAEEVSEW